MRPDMHHLLVERGHAGVGYSRHRPKGWSARCRFRNEEDDQSESFAEPRRQPMFSENLQPLYRFLDAQVGRPWDKVYSEIRARIDADNAVQFHILQHLYDRVARHVRERDDGQIWVVDDHGQEYRIHDRWHHRLLFVCPRTGILRRAPPVRRRPIQKAPPTNRPLSGPDHEYRQIDGQWYEVWWGAGAPAGGRRSVPSPASGSSITKSCAPSACVIETQHPTVKVIAMSNHDTISHPDAKPIKAWVRGVPLEDEARKQLVNAARMPFVHHHIAVMPDVHAGIGATVGSVIPTIGAIIPAAVGVDIGCGMCAVRTTLMAADMPESLRALRLSIEEAVPHGRTDQGGANDRGAWHDVPARASNLWKEHLAERYTRICGKHRRLDRGNSLNHLGTLGTGNHFIEICLDEEGRVWFMLHSGSRGVGNRFGQYFIELAKQDMRRQDITLPDQDLAYLSEGSQSFGDYIEAVEWAQDYARLNRQVMMECVVDAVQSTPGIPAFKAWIEAVNCHHNYVSREQHFGQACLVTRKGAVRAGLGDLGIIPGSMGARSFIVRGKGNPESFCSCSHGAGRIMSRTKAKKLFSLDDHAQATAHVECRKDSEVIDETPMAYKDIDAVMAAQSDLVEIVHTLTQVVCVKG
jgi:tRNA-splicing ligase RtcB